MNYLNSYLKVTFLHYQLSKKLGYTTTKKPTYRYKKKKQPDDGRKILRLGKLLLGWGKRERLSTQCSFSLYFPRAL
jgi:hypothetical protein